MRLHSYAGYNGGGLAQDSVLQDRITTRAWVPTPNPRFVQWGALVGIGCVRPGRPPLSLSLFLSLSLSLLLFLFLFLFPFCFRFVSSLSSTFSFLLLSLSLFLLSLPLPLSLSLWLSLRLLLLLPLPFRRKVVIRLRVVFVPLTSGPHKACLCLQAAFTNSLRRQPKIKPKETAKAYTVIGRLSTIQCQNSLSCG